MSPEYALNHLSRKLDKNKTFTVTIADKKAINALVTYHNNENTKLERYYDNFMKMYIMCFKIFLTRNKCLKIGQKAMHSIFSKSLDRVCEDFTERLNEVELFFWKDQKGFISKSPALISDEEKEHNLKLLEDNLDDYIDVNGGIWDKEKVKENLTIMARTALNRF